jgi:hypothetical protein
VSDPTVGNCLVTHLKHESVLEALDIDSLPEDLKEDKVRLETFLDRACEQAASLIEDLIETVETEGFLQGFRAQKISQRKTIEKYWYAEGGLRRPREKYARTLWYLTLGSLVDVGPSVALVIKPQDVASTTAIDRFAATLNGQNGLGNANARECFTSGQGFDCGVVVAAVPLQPDTKHIQVAATLRKQAEEFIRNHKEKFELALQTTAE